MAIRGSNWPLLSLRWDFFFEQSSEQFHSYHLRIHTQSNRGLSMELYRGRNRGEWGLPLFGAQKDGGEDVLPATIPIPKRLLPSGYQR
jgi:hypothetical protein